MSCAHRGPAMKTESRLPRRRDLARFSPARWPVRWRLAAVSASLTLLILLVFAFVVGRLASDRLTSDFHDDMFATANQLRVIIEAKRQGVNVQGQGLDLDQLAPGDVAMRVVDENGTLLFDTQGRPAETPGAPSLGSPQPEGATQTGRFEVVSVPVDVSNAIPPQPAFLQYGRTRDSLDATIDRLWLFLAGGVVGGTLLAMLAGIAVAGRAMRPIVALTQTAREIAATRDPSRRVPMPSSNDEVAELAVTLDQMLRELDASRSETEQIAQAQREFVADASHELRTPLTSILANLELLQARLTAAPKDDEESEIVEGALRSSLRMRRLVSDLLLLARADAGRAGVRSDCDLEEIVDSALAEVRPVANEHVLSLDESGSIPIEGNPDELHQLVANLLENGMRHTPPGTEVRARLHREGDEAVFEVSDNGPGIPEGMEEQVFSRFVRGGGPADIVADGGTGLGLAIVQAVAVSHGGRVEATRGPHGGARFEVRLPLHAGVRPGVTEAPAKV
jgi:two-component system OmpR family sensor kinase